MEQKWLTVAFYLFCIVALCLADNDKSETEKTKTITTTPTKTLCQFQLLANDVRQFIQLIQPQDYDRNKAENQTLQCTWLINTPTELNNKDLLFELTMCNMDKQIDELIIFTGTQQLSENLVEKITNCPNKLPYQIRVKSNNAFILFTTNNNQNYQQQFKLSVAVVDQSDTKTNENICLTVLNATNETEFTTSPGFPNNYPPNIKCTTMIEVEPDQNILLEIVSCQIETFLDFLFITIGSETIPILNSCPPYLPYLVPVKSNIVNITLMTDQWNNYKGFNITYKATESFTCGVDSKKKLDLTLVIPLAYINYNMKNGIKLIVNNFWNESDQTSVRLFLVIWDSYSIYSLLDVYSTYSTKMILFLYIDSLHNSGWSNYNLDNALGTVQTQVAPNTRGGDVPHSVVIFDSGYYTYISIYADKLKDAGVTIQTIIQNPSNGRYYELLASRIDYVISANNFDIVNNSWIISNRACYPDLIETKSCDTTKSVDLTFVVQDSAAFSAKFFNDFVKTSIKTIIKSFYEDVSRYKIRMALMTFGLTSNIVFNLDDPIYSIEIDKIFYRIENLLSPRLELGNDLANALNTVMTNIVPKTRQLDIPHIIVVLTDGKTTTNAIEQADLLKETGALVFGIGIGDSVEISTLNQISSDPNEYVAIFNDLSESWNFAKNVSMTACYPVNITSVASACNYTNEIDVTIIITDYRYTWSEFNILVKSTVKDIINNLWDESENYLVRFSLVFHYGNIIVFNLNEKFQSKSEIFQLIDKIQYRFSGNNNNYINYNYNLDGALYSTLNQIVPLCRNGNVPHVILIIDPGYTYSSLDYSDQLKSRGSLIIAFSQTMNTAVKSYFELVSTDIDSVFISNTIQNTFNFTTDISNRVCQLIELYTGILRPKPKSCGGSRTVDVTFLVQDSNAFSDSYFQQFVISSIKTIIRGFYYDSSKYNARISIMSFGVTTQIIISFDNSNSMEIIGTFISLNSWSSRKENGNDLASGLRDVRMLLVPKLRKVDVPYIVIVMTDGHSSTSVADEVKLLKNDFVTAMFAIGIGSSVTRSTLDTIASDPQYVFVGDNLPDVIAYTPNITSVVCKTIPITIDSNINCLQNFDGLDITFIISNYGLTNSQTNIILRSFLKTIINNLWSENKLVRYSVVNYDVVFNLDNGYENKTMIFDAINSMNIGYGDLNTALSNTRSKVVPLRKKGKIPHFVIIFDYGYYSAGRTEADLLKHGGSVIFLVIVNNYPYYRFNYDLIASYEQYVNVPSNWLDVATFSYQVSLTTCDPFVFNRTKSCNKIMPVDVTFLVQTSSSISTDNFTRFIVPNVINIIKALDEDSSQFSFRMSLLTFGSSLSIVRNIDWIYNYGYSWWTQYPQTPDIERMITAMEFNTNFPGSNNGNDLSSALQTIRTNILLKVRPVNVPHFVIAFTDGQSTTDVSTEANLLKKMNSTLFVIGIGNNIQTSILPTLASKSDFVLIPSTWRDVVTFSPKISGAVCQPKYITKPLSCANVRAIDITFVLSDNSYSVMDINIYFKSFIKSLMNAMWDESNNQRVHFSLVMNNGTPTIVFNLNHSFSNKSAVMDIVDDLQYDSGNTDLTVAFGLIKNKILPQTRGGTVPHFILFLSYGYYTISLSSDIKYIKQTGSTIFMMQMVYDNSYFYEVVATDFNKTFHFQSPTDILNQQSYMLDYMCNATVIKKIQSCSETKSLELTFVFEESSSTFNNIMIPTIKSLIKYFYDDASLQNLRVALISYADTSYVHFKQNTFGTDIVSMFYNIKNSVNYRGEGGNNLQYALNSVITEIIPDLQQNTPHIVIVMTSGSARFGVEEYANQLKKTQAQVFVLAIGNPLYYNNIQTIAINNSYIANITKVQDAIAFAPTIGKAACIPLKSYDNYANHKCVDEVNASPTLKYYQSPNYPSDYPINCFCRLNIKASKNEIILINITDCALENNYDYLTIYSGSEIDPNKKVENISSCPSLPYNTYILNSSSVITFTTDATLTYKGFKLNYHSVSAASFNSTTTSKPTMATTKSLECPSAYCKNGGTCQRTTCPNNAHYCCECRQDYTGDRCEYARQGVIGMAMRSTKAYQKELEDTSSSYYAAMVISFVSYILLILVQTFVRYSGFYTFFFYVTIIGFSQGSTLANSTSNVAWAPNSGSAPPSVAMPTSSDIQNAMVQTCSGNNNNCQSLGIDTNYIYVSVNPDLCASNKTNTCSNNAKCLFKSGVTYTCTCMDGYRDDSDLDSSNIEQRTGVRCTEECANQCNGGSCSEQYDNNVLCNCTFTREGSRCENLSGIGIALVIVFAVILPILIIVIIVIACICKKHTKFNSKVNITKFGSEDDFDVFEDPAINKHAVREPKIVVKSDRY